MPVLTVELCCMVNGAWICCRRLRKPGKYSGHLFSLSALQRSYIGAGQDTADEELFGGYLGTK